MQGLSRVWPWPEAGVPGPVARDHFLCFTLGSVYVHTRMLFLPVHILQRKLEKELYYEWSYLSNVLIT